MVGAGKPHSITTGSGGVWTANGGGRSVTRVEAATTELVATIATPDIAYDVETVGGSVWVTSGPEGDCHDGSVVARIDPGTNLVTESVGFPCAWALIADEGSLWVSGEDGRGTLLAPVVIGDPVP
jgi:hypothetical protein